MSRPSKLNPEVTDRFINGLKLGLTYELAASYAGVNVRSIYGWMQRGRDEGEGQYFQFLQAVNQAEGACAAICMGRIQKAAEGGSWQAAGWIMERRYGYSQQQQIKVDTMEDELENVEDIIAQVAEVAEVLNAATPDDE